MGKNFVAPCKLASKVASARCYRGRARSSMLVLDSGQRRLRMEDDASSCLEWQRNIFTINVRQKFRFLTLFTPLATPHQEKVCTKRATKMKMLLVGRSLHISWPPTLGKNVPSDILCEYFLLNKAISGFVRLLPRYECLTSLTGHGHAYKNSSQVKRKTRWYFSLNHSWPNMCYWRPCM